MFYFSQAFISGHITIHDRYCLLSLCKTWVKPKTYWPSRIIKMRKNEFKKVDIKHLTCYYFIKMKIEDFDFYCILLAEISYENILICDILHDTLIGAKPLRIIFDKVDGFIRDYGGTK